MVLGLSTDGACKGLVARGTIQLNAATSRSSVQAHAGMLVAYRRPILRVVSCASSLRDGWCLGLNVDVYL